MARTNAGSQDGNPSSERSDASPERVPLTHRVNVEPSVLRGMTVTEAKVIQTPSGSISIYEGRKG